MKVLMVHGRYRSAAPSGENVVVDRESAALVHAGHEVQTFERHSDEIETWPLRRKAALPARVVWNPQVRSELVTRIRSSSPDVVHVHNTFPLLSPAVLYACRDAAVPVVVTLHNYKLLCASGDFFRDGKPCHDCATGLQLPAVRHGCYRESRVATVPVVVTSALHRNGWRGLVSAHIFISAAQRDLMRHLDLPGERVFVKHNFVLETGAPSTRRDHAVAYLGRLDAAKGIPFLMRAWDRFVEENPTSSLRLVVAGGGPLAAYVGAWAAGHTSVDVVGNLPPDDARQLLRRSLAAVVPSQWEETFGLVAVEAMAAGVAPIAPDRGSFPELIVDGSDGVLFPAEDADALAAVLREVDRRPGRFVERGRRAKVTHQQRFSLESNVEQLLDVYRFAIAHPVGGPHATV